MLKLTYPANRELVKEGRLPFNVSVDEKYDTATGELQSSYTMVISIYLYCLYDC